MDELEASSGKHDVRQGDSLLPSGANKAPVALLTRAVLWIVLSAVFLVYNVLRMMDAHAARHRIGVWIYLQTAIWLVALVLWMRAGFLQLLQRRADER